MVSGLPDYWHQQKYIELIELINRITLIDAIAAIGEIVNIANIESLDLIDEITKITRIGSIDDVSIRANLIVNPGFERGDFTGWMEYGSPTIEEGGAFEGDYSAELDFTSYIAAPLPYMSGKNLAITVLAKNKASDNNLYVTLEYDEDVTDTYTKVLTTAWRLFHIIPARENKLIRVYFQGHTDNQKEVYVDHVSALIIPYDLRDSTGRARVLPEGQYLATPPTLSDEDYHHLTLTESGQIRTYDPLAATEVTLEEVKGILATPPMDFVLGLFLDEGAGTVAYDASLSGNDGTIDGATWIDSEMGVALDFDKSDDYINCGHDASLDIITELTIIVKIKFDTQAVTAGSIVGKEGKNQWWMDYINSGAGIIFRLWAGNSSDLNDTVLDLDTFYTLGITYKNSDNEVIFYVDGVADGSGTLGDATSNPSDDVYVGIDPRDAVGYVHDGPMKMVLIFPRVLTPAEMLSWHESDRPEVAPLTHPEYGLAALSRRFLSFDGDCPPPYFYYRVGDHGLVFRAGSGSDEYLVLEAHEDQVVFCSIYTIMKRFAGGTFEWVGKIEAPGADKQCFPGFLELEHGRFDEGLILLWNNEGTYYATTTTGGSGTSTVIAAQDWTSDTTFKIIWDKDNGNNRVRFYIDGGLVATHTGAGDNVPDPTVPMSFGVEVAHLAAGPPASLTKVYYKFPSFTYTAL